MAQATVRGSPLSRTSSIGMTLLGIITFLFVSILVGLLLIAAGLVMFWFYRRQRRQSEEAVNLSRDSTPPV